MKGANEGQPARQPEGMVGHSRFQPPGDNQYSGHTPDAGNLVSPAHIRSSESFPTQRSIPESERIATPGNFSVSGHEPVPPSQPSAQFPHRQYGQPGYAHAPGYGQPAPMPPSYPKPRRVMSMWAAIMCMVAALAVGLVAGLFIPVELGGGSSAQAQAAFEEAVDECAVTSSRYIQILDDGSALSIDTEGEESAGATFIEAACVLSSLEVPDSIVARVDTTRALDGRQTGSWDSYEASWIYHPDDGLSMVIEVVDE